MTSIDCSKLIVCLAHATCGTYILAEQSFSEMMSHLHPETQARVYYRGPGIRGYVHFNELLEDGTLSYLETVQRGFNQNWARWNPDDETYEEYPDDTHVLSYSFVPLDAINPRLISTSIIQADVPASWAEFVESCWPTAHKAVTQQSVAKDSTVRKPWLL